MKKKTLISFVLLAIIGASAVFAQAPTLDKLHFQENRGNDADGGYQVHPADDKTKRTGDIVIPDTYNGKPVTRVYGIATQNPNITSVIIPNSATLIGTNAFLQATGLTSIIIPASVTTINRGAFRSCTNLTSVTFQGSNITFDRGSMSFDGDLDAKFQAGGAGTYTRSAGGTVWTKVGGFSLNGEWTRSDGMKITITENGQNITITGNKPNNGGRLNDTYTKR